ncbi:MAG: hypothetical protein FWE01_03320 [Firmicutes bacterium]|nr:hypothetical protein [Bacillota bacterium]
MAAEDKTHAFIENIEEMARVRESVRLTLTGYRISKHDILDKDSLNYGLYRKAIEDGVNGTFSRSEKEKITDEIMERDIENGGFIGDDGSKGGYVGDEPDKEIDIKTDIYEGFLASGKAFTIDNYRAYATQMMSDMQFEKEGERAVIYAMERQIEQGSRENIKEEAPQLYEKWLVSILKHEKEPPATDSEYYFATQEFNYVDELFYEVSLDDNGLPTKIDFELRATKQSKSVNYRHVDKDNVNTLGKIDPQELEESKRRRKQQQGQEINDSAVGDGGNEPTATELNKEGREQIEWILDKIGWYDLHGEKRVGKIPVSEPDKIEELQKVIYKIRELQGIQQEQYSEANALYEQEDEQEPVCTYKYK